MRPLPIERRQRERIADEFDVALARAKLRVYPQDLEALSMLGHALTRLGRHQEAFEADAVIVRLRPDDPIALYNLACTYSNLGRTQEALDALVRAIEQGYEDEKHMSVDPDLEAVRKTKEFQALVERLEARRKAQHS